MGFRLTMLYKALTRRAALEDLTWTLTAARFSLRLLRLAARTPAERRFAEALGATLDDAAGLIRRLDET